MPTTTARRDITTGLVNLGEDFKSANPTLLQRVYPRRPGGFAGDLPALYIGAKNEALRHDSGTRMRVLEPQLVLVGNPLGSLNEMTDEMDTLVDTFIDYLTLHPHAGGSNSNIEPVGVRDVELEMDDVVYPTAVIDCRFEVLEGRSRAGA